MSGKSGQKSGKETEVRERYGADFLSRLDRRCREARDLKTVFDALVDECGGLDGLGLLELETIRRFTHLCRRMGKSEEIELTGGRIDEAALNDCTRSWLGLLRQVEMIKDRHTNGRDLAKAFEFALEQEQSRER